ncbi:hypothetical protein CP533_5550 [Ophiocordyceps camponoti-saundersi (nom. inval.)]|nr:hypothetical protein CP533_5550 [Ophiocordyceps camponoti-saundersi (nom. inval.)]
MPMIIIKNKAKPDPPPAVPPSLPPSVEEAYRRKCVQLKNRTNEVEDANDAARLRLARIKRQVEKLRIERAFLLEQLAKRTSTNVEDSEGSPSPPPTPADIRTAPDPNLAKPKDKPLRIKRGHRKSAPAGDAESKPGPSKPSPTSESQSKAGKSGSANGEAKPSRDAHEQGYDIYEEEMRPVFEAKFKERNMDAEDADWWVADEMERAWHELSSSKKEEYYAKYVDEVEARQKGAKDGKQKERKPSGGNDKADAQDDDIEMVHYDTEDPDQEQQTQKGGDE